MKRSYKLKEPKIVRRGRGESLESFEQRRQQRATQVEYYEKHSPLEYLNVTSLKRVCTKNGWIASGTKEELCKRIREAEAGGAQPISSSKNTFATSKEIVPMPVQMTAICFVAGQNALVEHIPKPIWKFIIQFLDGDDVLHMRSSCKYFYVICTPILGQDIKLWSLYCDAKRDLQLWSDLRRIGKSHDLLENIRNGIMKHGSTQGIADKIKIFAESAVVLKKRRIELKEETTKRFDEVNEAFQRIGASKYKNRRSMDTTPRVADMLLTFLSRVLHQSCASDFYLKRYVNKREYSDEIPRVLSYFQLDGIMEFAEAYAIYQSKFTKISMLWTWEDPRREIVYEQHSRLRTHLKFLYDQFKENGQIPNFELELNQFLKI
jgi:hypothetical protein